MPPEFREIDINSLEFDPQNPRLPSGIDSSDRQAVLSFMLEDAGLLDLMRSIAKQGFFPGEPLLVAPEGGKYIVVEGNRRFASCILLNDPGLAPTRPRQVADASAEACERNLTHLPVLVFPHRSEILDHLGYRHVTGIKEWEPLAKARFLQQRFEQEPGSNLEKFKSIARSIGSRADYVGRLLTAFCLYEKIEREHFYDLGGVNEDSIDFSLITSLLAYSSIVDYLGLESSQDVDATSLNASGLRFLTKFVFLRVDGRTGLGESRNIRTLANVLEVSRARDALESGASLAAASKLAGVGADAFRSLVAGARENLDLASRELDEAPIGDDDVNAVREVVSVGQSLTEAAASHVARTSNVREL